MHGHGKSDRPIVPMKPANKGGGPPRPAERVEGRGLIGRPIPLARPCGQSGS